MTRAPRDIRQQETIRAFVKAGGVRRKSKGGHQAINMPNGHIVSLPTGIIKVGLLQAEVRKSNLTMAEFVEFL